MKLGLILPAFTLSTILAAAIALAFAGAMRHPHPEVERPTPVVYQTRILPPVRVELE